MGNFVKCRYMFVIAMAGSLALSGCSVSDSDAADNDSATVETSPSASTSASASASASDQDVAMPEPKGIEVTPVVLDPTMNALPPEAAFQVQAALKEVLEAAHSFPELQKGSRPMQPGDAEILAPVMKPLMTDFMWQYSVDRLNEGKFPSWYEGGNPFDIIRVDGQPLEESWRDNFTPDENGYVVVHSAKQPITILAEAASEDGTRMITAKDVHYRVFFRNVLGEIALVERETNFSFQAARDGSWDYASDFNHANNYGSSFSQEQLDTVNADF